MYFSVFLTFKNQTSTGKICGLALVCCRKIKSGDSQKFPAGYIFLEPEITTMRISYPKELGHTLQSRTSKYPVLSASPHLSAAVSRYICPVTFAPVSLSGMMLYLGSCRIFPVAFLPRSAMSLCEAGVGHRSVTIFCSVLFLLKSAFCMLREDRASKA